MKKFFTISFSLFVAMLVHAQGPLVEKYLDMPAKIPITTSDTMPATPLTDRQIGRILVALSDGEIDAAKMAARRSRNTDVKEFARKMVVEHRKDMKSTKELLKMDNGRFEPSDVAQTIKDEADDMNHELRISDRNSFDKIYIDQQVSMHEKALLTINETLLPNVADPKLKAHLEKARDAVSVHLSEARNIQSKFR